VTADTPAGQSAEQFRDRARAWLAANAPRRSASDGGDEVGSGAGLAGQRAFQAKL
jgi:hypothetical protein